MKRNILNVFLFLAVATTITLSGCKKDDYSEGGSTPPPAKSASGSDANANNKKPTAQTAQPVTAEPQVAQ